MRRLDYEPAGDAEGDLVKVDILLQGDRVDAFSAIVHREKAYAYGVLMTQRLRELIPRQQFEVPIQAAIGARELLPGKTLGLCGKMSWQSVTGAISLVNASCWKSKKRVKSA
jgi:GTP-binding protein LepA